MEYLYKLYIFNISNYQYTYIQNIVRLLRKKVQLIVVYCLLLLLLLQLLSLSTIIIIIIVIGELGRGCFRTRDKFVRHTEKAEH